MRLRFKPALATLSLLLTLVGCSDESPTTSAPSTAAGGGGQGGQGGAPLTPPGDPEPFAVTEWMVTEVGASSDPVIGALIDGSFELPPAGQYLGLNWQPVVPGENGKLIDTSFDRLYAVARVNVPPGRHLFARGDTVATFYTDRAARIPGDFYHSKKMRVPLAAHEGERLIVVRAIGRRNTPEVELWSTDAEVVFNDADVTTPDLIDGDTSERPFGIAVLNTTNRALLNVSAKVEESEFVEATEVLYPALAPNAVTQLRFVVRPKVAPRAEDETLDVTLRIEGPSVNWTYDKQVSLPVVERGKRYRHTRRSLVDGSVQYQGVVPPKNVEEGKTYGLFLSLHGAGVEAKGQAASYGQMDWAYVVAATNRRPYGFDWEEWGRLDALEALDTAIASHPIDTSRIHLTGHSMGGHGTWHNGVHFAHRFGVIAPSAGWIAFDQYGGGPFPKGVRGRARAASMTLDFVDNLSDSTVYIIHGSADNNVPISHAKQMNTVLTPIAHDLTFHTEPGAGHWWDNDPDEPGADCVDFQPMIDKAQTVTRDPLPLSFSFRTPSPWVSATRSFATISSCKSPMENCAVTATETAGSVSLTTENVRTLLLDGDALMKKNVTSLSVDGKSQTLAAGPLRVGPEGGKTPLQHGPLNQVFHRPFCFVWQDGASPVYQHYAAWLLSWWSVIGNGHGCGLPLSELNEGILSKYNLVFLGVPSSELPSKPALPANWTENAVAIGGASFSDSAIAMIYPYEDRLHAYLHATTGQEHLLFMYTPFSSRAGMPDFFVFSSDGLKVSGFFDADWAFAPTFSEGF